MTPIDIEAIRQKAKRRWISSQQSKQGILSTLEHSVPWWLIIVGLGVFSLSAAHTAGVFGELSPIGYAGPFAIELVLLWAAFTRTQAGKISGMLHILEIITFLMAIGVNGIGAVNRVAFTAGINDKSFDAIRTAYNSLPVTTQAAILFIPFFAVFIPVATWAVGEGVATLIHNRNRIDTTLDDQWATVEFEEVYRGLLQELLNQGLKPGAAKKQTLSLLKASNFVQTRPEVSSPIKNEAQPKSPQMEKAIALLREDPTLSMLSVRALEERTGVSKSTWAKVKENGFSSNGHKEDDHD